MAPATITATDRTTAWVDGAPYTTGPDGKLHPAAPPTVHAAARTCVLPTDPAARDASVTEYYRARRTQVQGRIHDLADRLPRDNASMAEIGRVAGEQLLALAVDLMGADAARAHLRDR